jgi:hypothetical protein
MDANEKKQFVEELLGNIAGRMNQLIDSGKIPDEWDGVEIRWWIADNFANTYGSKKRKAEYNNVILTNNL